MSWQTLLQKNQVRPHTTSRQEVQGLRAIGSRDLTDAAIPGLSPDRSFATSYNAILDYVGAGVVTDKEAKEILQKAQEFERLVDAWMSTNHPQFV